MDPYTAWGMIFSVVMVLIVGGFVVSFPVVRRLGNLIEEWIRERQGVRLEQGQVARLDGQMEQLRGALDSLHAQVTLLGERQEFVENLIEGRHGGRADQLTGGDDAEES
jgi:hypothetical protein